jgi:hypothetical protein
MVTTWPDRLARKVPRFIGTSHYFEVVYGVQGDEVATVADRAEQAPDQTSPTTASWGLDRLERDYGVPSGVGLALTERRSRVLAVIRSNATATPRAIRNLARAFGNGEVSIVEDFAAQSVVIVFVDLRGLPPNLPLMQAALREFLPLHLGLTFRFRWLTWDELDHLRGTFPVTWDQLDTLNDGGPYTWDDFERLRPFGIGGVGATDDLTTLLAGDA